MDTVIYYFSSTGNSLETARLIAQKLGNTRLVSIPALREQSEVICEAARVGIIFPVYMFGLPLLVRRFAEKLRVTSAEPYIFAAATCGGSPGLANIQLREILRKNKLDLTAGYAVKMPGNYTPLYGGPEHKKLVKLINEAGSKINQIADRIINKEKSLAKGTVFFRVLGRLLQKNIRNEIPIADKKFKVRDACNTCGICERICPAANIYIQNGKPNWLSRCEHCLACLQWCPAEAIQWGKSLGRRRYHHPAVNVLDIEKSR